MKPYLLSICATFILYHFSFGQYNGGTSKKAVKKMETKEKAARDIVVKEKDPAHNTFIDDSRGRKIVMDNMGIESLVVPEGKRSEDMKTKIK